MGAFFQIYGEDSINQESKINEDCKKFLNLTNFNIKIIHVVKAMPSKLKGDSKEKEIYRTTSNINNI